MHVVAFERSRPPDRRIDEAELAILAAIDHVQALGADERLARSLLLLQRARDGVADFAEGRPAPAPYFAFR